MLKRYVTPATLAAAAVLLPVLSALPAEAAPAIRITGVYYDSPGSDRGGNASLNGEWVQIKNFSKKSRSLKNWRLHDKTGYTYVFGSFVLKPGKSVRVHSGRGTDNRSHLYWGRGWYVWNNTGDKAWLRNAKGVTVDTCSWTGNRTRAYC